MGSPVQFQLTSSELRPYVQLTWRKDYWPGIYSNYPAQSFPTETAAFRFAMGSIEDSNRIIRAEVYSKEGVLLDMFGEPYESV